MLSITWVTAALVVIATAIVFLSERHQPGAEIHNIFDAFLFSTSQLLTASSVAAPTTNTVKVLELFFDIYAITVVAALAGSFGSFFHRRSDEVSGRAKTPDEVAAAATRSDRSDPGVTEA